LKGFLSTNAISLSRSERTTRVIAQLKRLLGNEAEGYISYTEKLWAEEKYTYSDYPGYVMPHQNNGHPTFGKTFMNERLYFAGAETSAYFGGYMDGAVYSGLAAAEKVIDRIKKLQ
jgi:monoamine oxidase